MARKFLTSVDLGQNELSNARIQNLATDPGSPAIGQVWYNTTVGEYRGYNGSAVVRLDNAAAATTYYDVVRDGGVARTQRAALDLVDTTTVALTAADSSTNGTTEITAAVVPGGIRLDQLAAPTAAVALGSQRITGLADPTAAQDAATKGYVDAAAAGIAWKPSVRAVATTNTTLSGAQTVDGVALAAGDRVLLTAQTTASANGVYTVAAGTWSRSPDADTSAELAPGAAVFATEGTVYGDTGWVLATNAPIVLGTTALTWTQFTGLGQVVAGNGLTKTGATLDVGAGTGITVTADAVAVDTNVVPRVVRATCPAGTTWAITHSLGVQNVLVQVYEASTGALVEADVVQTSTTVATVTFAASAAAGAYRAVVVG